MSAGARQSPRRHPDGSFDYDSTRWPTPRDRSRLRTQWDVPMSTVSYWLERDRIVMFREPSRSHLTKEWLYCYYIWRGSEWARLYHPHSELRERYETLALLGELL